MGGIEGHFSQDFVDSGRHVGFILTDATSVHSVAEEGDRDAQTTPSHSWGSRARPRSDMIPFSELVFVALPKLIRPTALTNKTTCTQDNRHGTMRHEKTQSPKRALTIIMHCAPTMFT